MLNPIAVSLFRMVGLAKVLGMQAIALLPFIFRQYYGQRASAPVR